MEVEVAKIRRQAGRKGLHPPKKGQSPMAEALRAIDRQAEGKVAPKGKEGPSKA